MNRPDTIEVRVTPHRLGEMYVNTIVNLIDMLQSGHDELAAKGRNAPTAIMSTISGLEPAQLTDVLCGIASQFEVAIDQLADEGDNNSGSTARDLVCDGSEADAPSGLGTEIRNVRDQVGQAIALAKSAPADPEPFVALGAINVDITLLRSSPLLSPEQMLDLDDLERRIDRLLASTSRKNNHLFVSGQRHRQLFRAIHAASH